MILRRVDFSGKVAVVTGASMGIGEAIAQIFADHEASVILLSRDAGRAEAARDRVGHTERTLALSCDVRLREAIAQIFADHEASVILLSRDAGRAEAARDRVGHTERTLALSCDVRHRE